MKVLSSTAFQDVRRLRQLLAERVALRPALDRGDAIGRADRLAVMELEPVAQRERVRQARRSLNSYLSTICGWTCELRVHREQRVVDHVPVVAGDVGGGGDGSRMRRSACGMNLRTFCPCAHAEGALKTAATASMPTTAVSNEAVLCACSSGSLPGTEVDNEATGPWARRDYAHPGRPRNVNVRHSPHPRL